MTRRERLEFVGVALVALLTLALVARFRVVDDDEGYYLLAGEALLGGALPYRDFFFPQMPLSALGFAAWQGVFGASIASGRWLGVLGGALTTAMVFGFVARRSGLVVAGCAALALLANVLFFEWVTTCKTFAFTLPLGTFALLAIEQTRPSGRVVFLASLAAALAVSTRLLMAPLLLVLPLALAWRGDLTPERRVRMALGMALGVLPAAAFALVDFDRFWFGAVGYHALRSPGEGWIKDIPQKLDVLGQALLTPLTARRPDATGLQLVPLLAVAVFTLRRHSAAEGRALALGVVALAVVTVIPSPTWVQYFAVVVPAGVALLFVHIGARPSGARWAALGALAFVAAGAPPFVDRVVRSPERLRPGTVDTVSRTLDTVTPPGARVVAHWPAYLVATEREPHAVAMNQFARYFGYRLTPEARRHYGMFTEDDLRHALLGGEATAFVVGQFSVVETGAALGRAGWTRRADVAGSSIWGPPR